jgi:hypothetical protein
MRNESARDVWSTMRSRTLAVEKRTSDKNKDKKSLVTVRIQTTVTWQASRSSSSSWMLSVTHFTGNPFGLHINLLKLNGSYMYQPL